jgi:predicted transposase YdaD
MRERLEGEASYEQSRELWAATLLMMGLRYDNALIEQLLKGVQGTEESTTYQLILSRGEAKGEAKGEVNEARKIVLRLGRKRFGEPDAPVQKALRDRSLDPLEVMIDRMLEVESWAELLA